MKTLYILRHAKSSWDDHSLSDFQRPLNERGLRTARFVGTLMKERCLVPDAIVSSPAIRARQTAQLFRDAAGFVSEIRYDKRIYEALIGTLLSVVAELDNDLETVLLVGHNPGVEGLIYFFVGEIVPMPTASLATVELNIECWSEIESGCGRLRGVIRPKDELNYPDR